MISLFLDVHASAVHHSSSERIKRLSPGHVRLCPAKEVRLNARDFFRGRFSENVIIVPQTFKSVYCLNNTVQSHASRGQHCLSIMDCRETKTSKYFVVYDPAKRMRKGCIRGEIAKINSVPVECSCLWPRYLGKTPTAPLLRPH